RGRGRRQYSEHGRRRPGRGPPPAMLRGRLERARWPPARWVARRSCMDDATPPGEASAAPPDFGGRYADLTPLQERGVACTYSALDPRRVVRIFIKMLRPSLRTDPLARQIFSNEPAMLD